MLQLICALLMSLTLFVGQAQATNFYVRTDGNDACNGLVDARGTSGACAKAMIQAAVNLATTAGDVVIVHAGTYTGSPTFTSTASGSSGNLITIQAATGETVNISRATVTHNFNKVQGFRVTGSDVQGSAGIQVNGSFNQVLSNTLLGTCRGDAACHGMDLVGSTNTVSNNTWDGQSNGLTTSFSVGMHVTGSSNEIGPGNLVKDFDSIERMWELYGNANHVFNNEVRNFIWTIGSAVHPDIFQTFCHVSKNHIIERNYFHDLDAQIGNLEGPVVGPCTSDPVDEVSDWDFRNNVFANVDQSLFNHGPRINFYNNTFYHCGQAQGYVIFNGYQAGGGIAKNNLFVNSGINVNDGWYAGSWTADYNLVAATDTGGAKAGFSEAHGINGGNPHLTTVSTNCLQTACNFHITSGSLAIGAGTTIAGFTTDKDGNTRNVGAWDMGAYEFASGGGGDITPPAAPAGLRIQ